LAQIKLNNNNFTGGLPSYWNRPKLTSVDISFNQITGPWSLGLTSITDFDASHNLVSKDSWGFSAWLLIFGTLPSTMVNLNLGYNLLAGEWNVLMLGASMGNLQIMILKYNQITTVPNELWHYKYRIMDVSFNNLTGDLPNDTPLPMYEQLRFDGNPLLRSSTNKPLYWMQQQAPYGKQSSSQKFVCPSIVGYQGLNCLVTVDPSYYNYINCECDRGYYGLPPNCLDIPSIVNVNGNMSDAKSLSFSDSPYGSNRLTLGVDITWVIKPTNPDI